VRECFAISIDSASTDMWLVETRRREVNHGTVSAMILIIVFFSSFFPLCHFCVDENCSRKSKKKMTNISIRYRAALGRVCLKLVIVMGVTWIVDVVSWVVGGPHYIW
jgi:hypothetical protein